MGAGTALERAIRGDMSGTKAAGRCRIPVGYAAAVDDATKSMRTVADVRRRRVPWHVEMLACVGTAVKLMLAAPACCYTIDIMA